MFEKKIMNRNFVVLGAILIQLCLGAIYAWSVFTKKITLAIADGGDYGFSATQAAWVFSAGLAAFALVMVLVGPWAKKEPRKATMLGGAVLGLGYVLGGFLGNSFIAQFICIGLIGGAGIGIAYVVPIAVGLKWFPDKKGMIAGLGVAGFGFGATLWVKLAGSWFGGLLNTTSLFGLPGVQSVFIIYGIIFFLVVLLGSIVMVDPPVGYKPKGWEQKKSSEGSAIKSLEFTSKEMLKTPQYFMLLFMFIGSALAGLMVIYCIRLFGVDALQSSGFAQNAELAGVIAGTAMAFYAIFNGLGRIIWGVASDKIGRKMALFLMFLIQGIMMLLFIKVGGSKTGLIIGASLIGFNFGGNFALFPAITSDFFGLKNLGPNYGWVFLAYGVAGIAGPQVAGYFKDIAIKSGGGVEAWSTPFLIAGVACLISAALAIFVKPPKHKVTR
ncbi:MAG: OFA family MFS transporter [Candidatus Tenebribacter mawsonii]|nr:OFA family MFS transporter [Candidatus Tenebribacter mawsonii]